MPWRSEWQPTPVLLSEESHGWRSLVGYSPRGPKESGETEQLSTHARTGLKVRNLGKRLASVQTSLSRGYWSVSLEQPLIALLYDPGFYLGTVDNPHFLIQHQ